uniref:GST C-terminal domain-containing protein n=1 Tax=Ciona savignyi TaxID=51511 RepID=H2YP26_CIOSA
LYYSGSRFNYFYLKIKVASNFAEKPLNVAVNDNPKQPLRYEEGGRVFSDSTAISHIIGGPCLWGNSLDENSQIHQWVAFGDDLNTRVCSWVYPYMGLRNYNQKDVSNSRTEVERYLQVLDDHLLHNMFLVGNRITMADVSCAAAL